jgi:two-component system cell cycle response regulator DivK
VGVAGVLVVEDNDKNRKLVRDLLHFRGVEVIEATTGEAGFQAAVDHCPDLVVMDVQLPDTDGVAVLGRLRADGRTRSIPVVAVTAFAMRGDPERFLAAGFDAYIPKPIDVRTFADRLLAVIAEARP